MTYFKTGFVYQRLPTFASMTSFLGKSNAYDLFKDRFCLPTFTNVCGYNMFLEKSNAHINLLKTSYVFQRLPTFTKVSSITGLKKGLKKSNAFDLFEDR